MNKKLFTVIGWALLLGIAVSWISIGYSTAYLSVVPLVIFCFTVTDKQLGKMKKLSAKQAIVLVFSFLAAAAVAFGLILLAKFLIKDLLHLTGWVKTMATIIGIILALYPATFAFATVINKVDEKLEGTKG